MSAMAQSRPGSSEIGGANLPAQKIGANDLIAVSIYAAPELSRTVRVGPDGQIRLPMLQQRLRAEGLLPAELETAVAAAVRQEQILVDPAVTVTVVEYHSRPISVVGSVRRPLTFQAVGPVTLIDAITRAEGLSADAGPEILVSRAQSDDQGGQTTLIQRIQVKNLIDDADPSVNLRLAGGEEVRVPEVGKVYVVGNVRRPGAFPVQDASGASVLKILAMAEGLAPFADKLAFVYRRELGAAGKNEIPIELRKIIERKMPDVPLQANDILYIPDAKTRRLAVTALERLAGFGSATASGVLIFKR
jgi:polysaccharide export outer membrane protein